MEALEGGSEKPPFRGRADAYIAEGPSRTSQLRSWCLQLVLRWRLLQCERLGMPLSHIRSEWTIPTRSDSPFQYKATSALSLPHSLPSCLRMTVDFEMPFAKKQICYKPKRNLKILPSTFQLGSKFVFGGRPCSSYEMNITLMSLLNFPKVWVGFRAAVSMLHSTHSCCDLGAPPAAL